MKPGHIAPPRVRLSREKESLVPAMLWGALAALVIGAWMLAAHLEYVELQVQKGAGWDNETICMNLDEFTNGAEFRDYCRGVLAYE